MLREDVAYAEREQVEMARRNWRCEEDAWDDGGLVGVSLWQRNTWVQHAGQLARAILAMLEEDCCPPVLAVVAQREYKTQRMRDDSS
jgi:hypothetical protein